MSTNGDDPSKLTWILLIAFYAVVITILATAIVEKAYCEREGGVWHRPPGGFLPRCEKASVRP